ncbi:MAG: DUF6152 family protein [Phenylobacterium sp.]
MHPRRFRASLAVLAGALAIALPASAHHGWADYQTEESEVTGVVQSVELGAPHGLIKVKAANGVWDVMLAPPAGIQRAGLEKSALPVGTRVTARGHRHNDPARLEIKTERLVVGNRTYDLYPNRP